MAPVNVSVGRHYTSWGQVFAALRSEAASVPQNPAPPITSDESAPLPSTQVATLSPRVQSELPGDVAELLRNGYAWHSASRYKKCQAELDALDTWIMTTAKKQVVFSKTKAMDLLAADLAEVTQYRIREHTGYSGKIVVYKKYPLPTHFNWIIREQRHWSSVSREFWKFTTLDEYNEPVPPKAARALQFTFGLPIKPEQVWVADLKEQKEQARPLLDLSGLLSLPDPVLWVSFGRHLVPIAEWK